MEKTILIAVAGSMGTLVRFWLAGFAGRHWGEKFPWGTMSVNLAGCFFAGAAFYLSEERFMLSANVRTAILIGLLGGFTTFSTYGLQTFALLRDGELGRATLNIAASNILGLLMVWAGYAFGKAL